MKRHLVFLLLSLAMMANATPVKKDVAAQKAKAFLKARHGLESPTLSLAMQGRQKTIGMGTAVTDPYYYVFNKGNNEGFVIIAGDDCAAEVLGYVDSGSFNPADMPPNMKEMLNAYAEEIAWARANVKSSSTYQPVFARQVVAPLMETKWGQENPYNLDCFTLTGRQAVTGCVATALAQVMYYHKWPKNATTEIPRYTTKIRNITDDDYYDALPPVTFDWDNIQTTYNGTETSSDPKAAAVAQLMHYCGHASKMSYGTGGSAAALFDCITALNDYFGYANTPICIQRSCYTREKWEEIIYNELHHGRPVLIGGNTYYDSGHAFVCDGYDGEGFFHINWGWEGKSDGYYRLESLNPASQGMGTGVSSRGFTFKNIALVGISPTIVEDGSFTSDIPKVMVEDFKLTDESNNTFNYNGGYLPSVGLYYAYSVPVTGEYNIGIGLYQDDEMIDIDDFGSRTVTSAYAMAFRDLTLGDWMGWNLADGIYQLKGICMPDGETEWYKNDDADFKYIEVKVANGKVTYTSKLVYPVMEVVDVRQLIGENVNKQVRVTLRNIGDVYMKGPLFLLINDSIKSIENACLEAGEEGMVDFTFLYENLAPVSLKVASGSSSNVIYEDDHFQFAKTYAPAYPEVLAKEIRYIDEANQKMYGKVAEASFTLRNNNNTDYNGIIEFHLGRKKDDGWWGLLDASENVNVKAGETKVVTIKYINLNYGDEIRRLSAECAGQSVSASGNYIVTPGVFEWDCNGHPTAKALGSSVTVSDDAAAVSFDGLDLTGKTIIPNSNPNTIYYLDANASTPSRLSSKNVVKGLKANAFHLVEGHPYYVPYTFDVNGTADYSFSPVRACDGSTGWQTLTLPFTVTTAKANGSAKNWNRNRQDDGKDFWVREYGYVEDATAYFHNASEWIPSEPYLIGVPASLKNASWVLSATGTRVFKSEVNTMVGSGYRFVGATGEKQEALAYMLNNVGDAFVKTTAANILPGDAYFLATGTTNLPERILIARNGLMGDVNGDGFVNVSDVSTLVDHILNKPTSVFIMANADVNGDNSITIADVTGVVNIILKIEN